MCDKGQGTTTDKRCERRKKGGKKASERRANARKENEGRVKGAKAEGERKQKEKGNRRRKETEGERTQQRKMVALETARPHQNFRSDADGHDEMRDYPT